MLFSQFSETVFGKEAYPEVWVNLRPGSLSAHLSGERKFECRVNTSWFRESFSPGDLERTEFDPDDERWKYTCDAYEAPRKRRKDKAVAFTDLLDAVTCTGQLRRDFPPVLLKDMFLNGRKLKKVLERVHELFFRYYDESCRLINVSENGCSTWAGL